jgi:oxygen-dependent protoporphyrinogen oxidase
MPSKPRVCDVVVVGAGIAGLSAAWEIRDRDVVVLEAADRVGGRIRSEPRDDYWLNFGAHVFSGPDSAIGRLIASTGVEARPVPGRLTALALNGRIVASGVVESYPLRLPLTAATRASFVTAGLKLRRAVAEYHRLSETRSGESAREVRSRVLAYRNDRTFADFLGHVEPDVAASLRATINRSSAEPDDLAAGCGIGFFALVWSKGKGLSRNIVGGSSTLPEAVARLLGNRVVRGASVREVLPDDAGVTVCYAKDGRDEEARARACIVAVPAYEAARIVAGLPPDTREALESIPYGPYLVMAIHTAETRVMPWDSIYALATPKRSFNMLFNMANVLREPGSPRRPGGSLMVYATADGARRLLEQTDAEVADTFLADLHDLYPETRGIVAEAVVQRWERALPYPRPGRAALQPALERPLGRGNVFLAGDYLGTWYTETAAETGEEAARAARAVLTGQ